MKNTNYLKEELYELIKTDESIFDFIQESSLDGLWYWDLERPEEEWMNPKFWSVLGYNYREMPHKASAWKDIIYPEDLKLATENFIKHCENPDHPYDQTVRYTHKNGSTVWIRCRGLAIRDKHGKPLRMLGAHQDITEIKNNELLLQMKTDQLRNAQHVSKVGSWELDLKTNKVVWTEELYNMYGFDPALPPPPYTEQMKLFTPESWQIITSAVAITKEQGIPYELELTTIRKDGGHGWMWVRGEAVFDENKNIIGLRGVTQDISEKKILELEKEALIKRLNYALDASGDGIWDWTPANGITVFSKAWIEMLGYEVCELASLASEWSDRLHPDDAEWVFAAINKVTQTPENGDTFSHEYRFKNKAGDYLWILNKAKVVERNEKGEAIRVVGTHTNITKEKETRRQIEEAKQQAEAANKSKSEFLANMSHEIRTPMNAVLGMLQLIKTTELSRQQDDYTSKAQIAAKSLLNLINDILDYSKIEAGKLELECHPFQLDELMRELAVVLSPNLGKKNIELLFDIDMALPDVLRGDRLRLQQILINLAGNAIKFTEVGEVVVQIQQLTIQNNICQMRVSVTDTGIGISREQQQRIFDGFTQAEASTARKYGGSGLGLVISKQMIHLMGGELQLKSQVGNGSCFWFDLSLPIEVNATLEDTTHYSFSSDINVLIVDDNEAALEVLARSVEQFGATVFKASSGDEALMQFTQCMEKKQTIHAVLMDYRMPGMDGLNAAREIKNRAGIDQVPMVVMVTAFGREEIIHAQQTGNSAFEY
ncbi:PAS domain S-box/PAS domain S-box, partial [Rheinheimera sp. A13L]|uniref:PAS domain-containing protein n=1 Tax=Rheinheimera sp. A13L TaxID=506534 RepID=UPI00021250CF